MRGPGRDPRRFRRRPEPTWGGIVAAYAIVAAVPLLLWAAAKPVVGATALAAAGGLAVGTRRMLQMRRCLNDCGGFAVDLAGDVRVCVTREATVSGC